MQPLHQEPQEERIRWLRFLGLAMTVPMILLSGPLVGLFVGMWLDRRFHLYPWFTIVGVAIGLLSSAQEAFQIIRRIDREGKRGR